MLINQENSSQKFYNSTMHYTSILNVLFMLCAQHKIQLKDNKANLLKYSIKIYIQSCIKQYMYITFMYGINYHYLQVPVCRLAAVIYAPPSLRCAILRALPYCKILNKLYKITWLTILLKILSSPYKRFLFNKNVKIVNMQSKKSICTPSFLSLCAKRLDNKHY